MGTIERRLEALEANAADTALRVCWLQDGETEDAAINRVWPEGNPRGTVLLISWQGEHETD